MGCRRGLGQGPPALADADEWVLRYDCFLGDVIFMVYEVDLSLRWDWPSTFLDLALGLDAIVDALSRDGGAPGAMAQTTS